MILLNKSNAQYFKLAVHDYTAWIEKNINKNIIENESIQFLFSRFDNNKNRVSFLLSFSNIADSVIFSQAEIRKIKYKFDKK